MLSWLFLAHGIGCIVLSKLIFEIGNFFYVCFLRPGKDLKKSYGEWAVVTGATDGIGKAMAQKFLKQGMKVLVVGRTPSKLEETVKEIGGGETLCVDFNDFASKKAERDRVKEALANKDIGVLVNNVGISYDFPQYFHELDEQRIEQLVKLNIDATNYMTHMVLPKMVEKKKGAIVNISSAACQVPNPLLAAYSGAKRYIEALSIGLNEEYKSKGVHVQVQTPLYVTTKLAKIRKASLTTPTPAGYAASAVRCIGYEADISPYWAHYVMMGVAKALPQGLVAGWINSMHHGIRKKALAKKDKGQ